MEGSKVEVKALDTAVPGVVLSVLNKIVAVKYTVASEDYVAIFNQETGEELRNYWARPPFGPFSEPLYVNPNQLENLS